MRDRPKRQTRLTFSPLDDSSPARLAQPPAARDRVTAVTYVGSKKQRKVRDDGDQQLPSPSSSGVLDSRNLPSVGKQAQDKIGGSKNKHRSHTSSSDSESSNGERPARKQQTHSFMTPSSSSQHTLRSQEAAKNSSPVDSPSGRAKATSIKKHVLDIFDDSESNDDAERRSAPPSRQNRKNGRVKESKEKLSSDDELITVPTTSKNQHKQASPTLVSARDDSDISEQSIPVRPVKRRRLQRPPRLDSQEAEDLQDDLEFLGPASPDTPRTPRQRESSTKTARQSALQALKQKRELAKQGNSSSQPQKISDDSSPAEEERQAYDSEDSDDALEYAIEASKFERGGSEDFVVPDEDVDVGDDSAGGPLNYRTMDPEDLQLPLEFRLRTMKPKELFRFVVEWMVQKKINPGFEATEYVYRIAFSRIDDIATGMGGSKFQSAAWTPAFLRALKSRPHIREAKYSISELMSDHCDACNRSGHPATYQVEFSGPIYDKRTLEDLEDDSDAGIEVNGGRDEQSQFFLGRFCMAKARVAHTLAHWQYHLSEWVIDWLIQEGHCTPARLVERDRWRAAKRAEYADKVMEDMEQRGEIKALFKAFQAEINAAMNAEEPQFR